MFVCRRFDPDYLRTDPPVFKKHAVIPENQVNILNNCNTFSDMNSHFDGINELEPSKCNCLNDSESIVPINPIAVSESGTNIDREELARWAIQNKQTRASTNQLLSILRKTDSNLPKDYRTLCHTPRKIEIEKMSNGNYIHLGLRNCIKLYFQINPDKSSSNELDIDLNIDGVPVAVKSNYSLWPVLMSISSTNSVYVIGVFYGKEKPKDINEYLKPFVTEFLLYKENGLEINNRKYHLNIRCIVADAPARAFLLDIKTCSGYNCCHKCKVLGKYVLNRVTFPGINHETRTSQEFRNKTASEYHHNNDKSIVLEQVPELDLVKNIPIDYMHCLLLGVIRQLLVLWIKCRLKAYYIRKKEIAVLSSAIQSISKQLPKEFQRKVDELQHCRKFKATEYRQLLYILPVALLAVEEGWRDKFLNHFLKLCCAFRILCSPSLCISQNNVASKLLESFVQNFKHKYGGEAASFNVHSLLHLSEDVLFMRKPLDDFSCFKFENYLQILKKKLNLVIKCWNK